MAVHPDPYDLLKSIIRLSASPVPIEVKLDGMLETLSGGFQPDRCLLLRPDKVGPNGFLSRLAIDKKPLWVEEGTSFPREGVLLEEEDLLCPSFVCVPLYNETTFQGILYIGFSKSRKFSTQEVDLLLLIGKEMEETIRNARVQQEAEQAQEDARRVKQLSILWELNKALLTTVNFERILHMTLTAITIGDGLGFNRAMLFMVNEKKHILEGTLAVAPDSAEEAGRIWSTLSGKKEDLSNRIARIQISPETNSVLNSIVKGIEIPLEQEQCILSRTVLEGRPFNIQPRQSEVGIESESTQWRHDSRSDLYREGWLQTRCARGCHLGSEVGCYVSEHLSRDPKVYSFATVPLWGKGQVIGVILVDNLYNQHPITDEDIRLLSMFANQVGLAIGNALLYRNLEEIHQELKETQNLLVHREKMAALGELCNSVVHEIKNPLVSIGGFARRLYRALPDEASEKRYSQSIMIEVGRLERILDDLYNYTRNESMAYQECDLRNVLEHTLSMISERFDDRGIILVKEFTENLPKINGDYHQLEQAFFNVISNAYQAMNGKGTLSIRIRPLSKNGSSFHRVEFEDTGGGIDPENLHNIFNPFYSTKDTHLGLGLPIVHKIILSHRGRIEVDNHPGEGATFIITLPASESTLSTDARLPQQPAEKDGGEAISGRRSD